MTPAPPVIIDLSDSDPESDDDNERRSMSSKRAREIEMEPARFIDLRQIQAGKHAEWRSQADARPSRRKFLGRKRSIDAQELEKRVGTRPQKKIQMAYKSIPKGLETGRPVQSKSALLSKFVPCLSLSV